VTSEILQHLTKHCSIIIIMIIIIIIIIIKSQPLHIEVKPNLSD